jgi:hypothetical protein
MSEDQECMGTIRVVGNKYIGISLFPVDEQEITGDMNRSYFPDDVKIGDVFKYSAHGKKVSIEMISPRELSPCELEEMAMEVKEHLSGIDERFL